MEDFCALAAVLPATVTSFVMPVLNISEIRPTGQGKHDTTLPPLFARG
jgi:hypothetical protein